ncbi:hypothetical protein LD752_09810 [Salmonella enterica]|nr:hypothetical protein [Salmonella enterica subsp. enterica serovar Pomona]MDJ4152611.1 hypothetical protein [Salmonella enterica]MDJ6557801.1 hypothetical protein [Salmonella enterica]MDJ6791815.1 hypothetical protein [Salmonella enterica]MDJ7524527.1 hypothetical protein [Salmonella enterica]
MKKKIILNLALAICVFFSAISLISYFINFHTMPISQKTSDWSNFGSYVSGTVGPLMSLISILFILKSINSSNKNHNDLMQFSVNDKLHNQIKDLSNALHDSIAGSFLFKKDHPNMQPFGIIISHRIKQMINIKSEISIEDVAKSAVRDVNDSFESEIKLIIKLIHLLTKLNNDDREVYKLLIETKLTHEHRAVLFSFACKDFPENAEYISQHWPSFTGEYFKNSAPFSPPQNTNIQ